MDKTVDRAARTLSQRRSVAPADAQALPQTRPAPVYGGDNTALRLALDLSPVPAFVITGPSTIQMCNDAAQQLFAGATQALIGRDLMALLPKAPQRASLTASLARSEADALAAPFDILAANGPISAHLHITPLQIGEEQVSYMTCRPLTSPDHSQRHLADALNAAGAAIMMVAEDGTVELVNDAACRLLAGTESQLVGSCVDDYVPQISRQAHARYRAGHALSHRTHAMAGGRSLKALGLDRHETSVEISLSQIDLPDGPRVLVTLVDITNRLEHERQITARNDHLAALNEELTQFAYSASHDLRAPLATIAGLLELCLEDLDAGELSETRHNITDALKTSRRNIHKVEAVLTLARAGLSPVAEEVIDLPRLVAACWDDLPADGRPKPAITVEMDGPCCVRTERQTLSTVIENVLSNACRFQNPDKAENWVQVRLRTLDGAVSILIGDNGVGIPEADQPRVFEMFRRSTQSQGHGLGLALVQKNVLRLGGTIVLCSSPERTDFIFSFPMMEVTE